MNPKIRLRPRPGIEALGAVASTPSIRRRPPPTSAPCDETPSADGAGSAPEPAGCYEVGRGKPPVSRRFGQPGGNRSGRKKGSKNFDTLLTEELQSVVTVMQDGRQRRLTKQQLIVRTLVNGAAQGKLPNLQLLLRHAATVAPKIEAVDAEIDEHLEETSQAILDRYAEQIRASISHAEGDDQ